MTKEEIRTDNTETLKNALRRIEELEKENKTISRKANEAIADKLLITAKYNEILNDLNQQNDKLQKYKKDSNLDEVFEEMTKKAEKGITLAEQIVDLKSDHKHNLELMKGLNDKIADLEKENTELKKELKDWKEEWQEQVQKATDEGWERTKLTGRVRELEQQIEKMKFWHDREEMVVIRDLLTEYMSGLGDDEYFDVAIFNVRNRLNGELKNE